MSHHAETPLVVGLSDDDHRLMDTFYRAIGGQLELLDDILADDWRGIPAPGVEVDADHFKPHVEEFRNVFPDAQITVHAMIGGTGYVAVRAETEGMQRQPWLGVPATGKRCAMRMAEFHEIRDGRITRTWPLNDVFGWMQQVRSS